MFIFLICALENVKKLMPYNSKFSCAKILWNTPNCENTWLIMKFMEKLYHENSWKYYTTEIWSYTIPSPANLLNELFINNKYYHCTWNAIWIIDGSDNQGLDSRGSTVYKSTNFHANANSDEDHGMVVKTSVFWNYPFCWIMDICTMS